MNNNSLEDNLQTYTTNSFEADFDKFDAEINLILPKKEIITDELLEDKTQETIETSTQDDKEEE